MTKTLFKLNFVYTKKKRAAQKHLFAELPSPEYIFRKKAQVVNREYYINPENLRHDLLAFARALGPEVEPSGLTVRQMRRLVATCRNGRETRGSSYLARASAALTCVSRVDHEALQGLLHMAGLNRQQESA